MKLPSTVAIAPSRHEMSIEHPPVFHKHVSISLYLSLCVSDFFFLCGSFPLSLVFFLFFFFSLPLLSFLFPSPLSVYGFFLRVRMYVCIFLYVYYVCNVCACMTFPVLFVCMFFFGFFCVCNVYFLYVYYAYACNVCACMI